MSTAVKTNGLNQAQTLLLEEYSTKVLKMDPFFDPTPPTQFDLEAKT